MKLARMQVYRKSIVVLICLLIIGNSAPWVVLCFGADGHIEIELAFHECCDDTVHSQLADQNQLSPQVDHVKDEHCEPCVDVPISISLAKISRSSKQLNLLFSAQATNVIVTGDKLSFHTHNSAPNTFDVPSYFSHLRTVVLLA